MKVTKSMGCTIDNGKDVVSQTFLHKSTPRWLQYEEERSFITSLRLLETTGVTSSKVGARRRSNRLIWCLQRRRTRSLALNSLIRRRATITYQMYELSSSFCWRMAITMTHCYLSTQSVCGVPRSKHTGLYDKQKNPNAQLKKLFCILQAKS